MPGMLKICSMSTAPPMMRPTLRTAIVMMLKSAFRKACRRRMINWEVLRSGRDDVILAVHLVDEVGPEDARVRAEHSEREDARREDDRVEVRPQPAVIGTKPPEGNQWRWTANTVIAIRPTTNWGHEKPNIVTTTLRRSSTPRGFSATTIDTGMAKTNPKTNASRRPRGSPAGVARSCSTPARR